jgi:hypothetical protein
MMSPENVSKMSALSQKGQPVKRPAAAYGEAFSGIAALGKSAASVFGPPASGKRVSVPVAPVNVGSQGPFEKVDASQETDTKSQASSGRSTPSQGEYQQPDMSAMMGFMQQMASQMASLGQTVEGLKSSVSAAPSSAGGVSDAERAFRSQLASVTQQMDRQDHQQGVAELTSEPDLKEMLTQASKSKGVSVLDAVGKAMLNREHGPTERQIRSHLRDNKVTARSTAEMLTLAMAIDKFKEGRQEEGLEILHRRLIGVFYSDTRSNWNIMEALLPTSGQLLENGDLAKILLDAKRLSGAKGDKDKTPNGKRNRSNRSGSSPFYGGRHRNDVRNNNNGWWSGQGQNGGQYQAQSPQAGYYQHQGDSGGRQGGFSGAPRGRGRGRF